MNESFRERFCQNIQIFKTKVQPKCHNTRPRCIAVQTVHRTEMDMEMFSSRVQTSPPTYGFVSKTPTIFEPALEMQTNPADHFHLSGITVRTLRISTTHFNWRQGEMKSLVFAYVIEVFYFVFLSFLHMIK